MATTQSAISKKRKFVADGVFYAELNEFFQVCIAMSKKKFEQQIDCEIARAGRGGLLWR